MSQPHPRFAPVLRRSLSLHYFFLAPAHNAPCGRAFVLRALLWLCLAGCLGAASTAALAQNNPATSTAAAAGQPASDAAPPPTVDELRKQLDAIPQKLGENDDGRKLIAEVNAIGGGIFGREHGDDAGCGQRRRGVDACYPGMAVG